MDNSLIELENKVDLMLKRVKVIYNILNKHNIMTVDYTPMTCNVDLYEIYKKNYGLFDKFIGNDMEDKWNKNMHKPEFIRIINNLTI